MPANLARDVEAFSSKIESAVADHPQGSVVVEVADSEVVAQAQAWVQDHFARSRAAGFDHHLVKPVDLSTLQRITAEIKIGADRH